ncbi:beta-ketoacyl synthase N-terminal-like domain-containing protein [Streptomyces sp. NRRL S-37]|uniref:beta-ketoacyl synthase N-terminal-like domain-containing protein n=1 Tax=Streptomyces sp. NRRL S-37 TaxID=1463903 RepID=UPI0004C49040|nr:beta-ketoacyl synthase N-terminal-like domain-containing protein [Streptomyces sp. NRRL S-37]
MTTTAPETGTRATAPGATTVISEWSVLSPYGIGAEPFAEGVSARRPVVPRLNRDVWQGPDDACLVPGFDIVGLLGSRGTRTMDRLTGLTVATLGTLLEPDGSRRRLDEPEHVGLVLGTGSGSVQSTMDFTRDALTGAKPFYVDPALFPNTVMNRAAGQSAIWYGLKGPNATLAGGPLTGLQALRYATRLRERGYSRTVLCGAVEEYSEQRAWLAWHTRGEERRRTPLAEACAMFLLEDADTARDAGRTPRADILAVRFAAGPQGTRPALERCVRGALEAAGTAPHEVAFAAPSGRTTPPPGACPMGFGQQARADDVETVETTVLGDVLDGTDAEFVGVRELLGDASAASAGVQLAAVLAAAAHRPRPGAAAVVTSVDDDGLVACLVLRLR